MGKKIQFKFMNFPQDLFEKLKKNYSATIPPSSKFYEDDKFATVGKAQSKLELRLSKIQLSTRTRTAHAPHPHWAGKV